MLIALSNTDQIQDSMENIVNMEKKQQNYLKGMYGVNKNCIRMVGFFFLFHTFCKVVFKN